MARDVQYMFPLDSAGNCKSLDASPNSVELPKPPPRHDGETFDVDKDGARLNTALARVYQVMRDGDWWTLKDLSIAVGCSESSVGARLRDLRKERFKRDFPNNGVERMRSEESDGLWLYRMKLKEGQR